MLEPQRLIKRLGPLPALAGLLLAAWILLDLALMRSGLYYAWVQPDSTVGSTQAALRLAQSPEVPAHADRVLLLGDSRLNEGVSLPLADAGSGARVHHVRASAAGTTPRVWYYLLREIDPRCDRFDAVALLGSWGPLGDIENGSLADRRLDLAYLTPLLRVSDLLDFPDSFSDPELRQRARRTVALPLLALRDDILSFAASPLQRIHGVRKRERRWVADVLAYPGREGRMPELAFPPEPDALPALDAVPAPTRAQLEAQLRKVRRSGVEPAWMTANRDYLGRWLGRIADHCASSATRLFLVQLPRGPYHGVLAPIPGTSEPVATLIAAGRFGLLDPPARASLESPDRFFDALHLNREGRRDFSAALGAALADALVNAPAPALPAAAHAEER